MGVYLATKQFYLAYIRLRNERTLPTLFHDCHGAARIAMLLLCLQDYLSRLLKDVLRASRGMNVLWANSQENVFAFICWFLI